MVFGSPAWIWNNGPRLRAAPSPATLTALIEVACTIMDVFGRAAEFNGSASIQLGGYASVQ
jgi:hypothetical protein